MYFLVNISSLDVFAEQVSPKSPEHYRAKCKVLEAFSSIKNVITDIQGRSSWIKLLKLLLFFSCIMLGVELYIV